VAIADGYELLRADMEAHLHRRISEALGELLQRVSALRGLAKTLEAGGEVATDAEQERIEDLAAGVRALATEVIATAASCIGIGERLRAYASMRGLLSATEGSPPR
jgi:hypothetical protein